MRSQQLLSLRRSAHLSQRELAKLIGVSAPAISQVERGLTQLTDEHARKVLEVVARRKELISKVLEHLADFNVLQGPQDHTSARD
jgi:transcriptional regulator with XRE-family HTH domain